MRIEMGSLPTPSCYPLAERFQDVHAGALDRCAAEQLQAEPLPRVLFVDPEQGIVRPHLRAVAAERRELPGDPVANVDAEGGRHGLEAEHLGCDAPQARVWRCAAF